MILNKTKQNTKYQNKHTNQNGLKIKQNALLSNQFESQIRNAVRIQTKKTVLIVLKSNQNVDAA